MRKIAAAVPRPPPPSASAAAFALTLVAILASSRSAGCWCEAFSSPPSRTVVPPAGVRCGRIRTAAAAPPAPTRVPGIGRRDPVSSSLSTTTSLCAIDPSSLSDSLHSFTVAVDPIVSISEVVLEKAGEMAVNALGRDFMVFLAASVAVVPLSKRMEITPVLGFLAAGCLLGPHGLGAFANTEADLELGDVGILFLLFSEGLNLSVDRLKELARYNGLGLLQLLVTMSLFFFGILFGGPLILEYVGKVIPLDDTLLGSIVQNPNEAFVVASAGALSSSAFVLPVLKQKGWEERPEGIAALSVLLLQDLAVAPLLVILPLIAGTGPQSAGELGVLAAKATVGFGAVLAVGSVLLRYVFDAVAAARSTETFVAAALLVALGMGQAAEYLGLSASTGAFAAGVLLAGNRYRAQIQADVRPFEGILLGIFFLTAGASLDPQVVMKDLPTLVVGILVFIVAKAAVLFAAGPAVGNTPAQAARVGITLAGGGEFSFVVFKLAQDLGVLPYELSNLLTASVVISMSLTPLLGELADFAGTYLESREECGEGELCGGSAITPAEARALFDAIDVDGSGSIDVDELRDKLVARGVRFVNVAEVFKAFDANGDGEISLEEWKAGIERGLLAQALAVGPGSGKDEETTSLEIAETIAPDAVVICGFTEFGREMYGVLESAGIAKDGGVVAVDLNPSRVAAGILSGATAVYGDGASVTMLRAAGIREPRAVIVAYRSEARRLEATSRLRDNLPPGTPIYARVVSGQELGRAELLAAGATEVVSERIEAALRFGELLGACGDNADRKSAASVRVRRLLAAQEPGAGALVPVPGEGEVAVPGLSELVLYNLSEELGCKRRDLVRLHDVFTSLPDRGRPDPDDENEDEVDIEELRDLFLRLDDFPMDNDDVKRWVELADRDGGGKLSFYEFARAYFKVRETKQQGNGSMRETSWFEK